MSLVKALFLAFSVWTSFKLFELWRIPPLPLMEENPWWGPGKQTGKEPISIKPFKINIPQSDIDDLNHRLSLPLRLAPGLENANFTYGFNSDVMNAIINHWRNKYNWRNREARLNNFPQFMTQIEGLNIHFIHIKPKLGPKSNRNVKPLLLIHGWPGSVVEFDEILPLLTSEQEGSDVVFEVICPSIPGYGFSQPSTKIGMGGLETAQIFLKLMKRLGFNQFYVQGGDWGSLVSSFMATLYPENVLGMHINMVSVRTLGTNLKYFIGSYLPSGLFMDKEEEESLYPISTKFSYLLRESGYFHIQSTKPDTVGVALSNSPIGLAAYILEKFSSWTHKENPSRPDGGLLSQDFPISLDRMLDNICLYWFTQTITPSMRYYAENMKSVAFELDEIPTDVPAGFSAFAHEILNQPQNFVAHKFSNIIAYRRHPVGGHFAAMEQPKILSKDIHEFVILVEQKKKNQEKTDL